MNRYPKKRINLGEVTRLKGILRNASLNTVCESARCPNIGECFCKGTATFLILGTACTRGCRFCAVEKAAPHAVDPGEPARIAAAVARLGLSYAVVTSVTRDDLPDGGAGQFHETVRRIREEVPGAKVEILVPDFKGDAAACDRACDSRPDVFAHNIETVPSLYAGVRCGADYRRSLEVLSRARGRGLTVKSGLMLGLGETPGEVLSVMKDLRTAGCDILTLGQYLAPSASHYPVRRFVEHDEFERLRDEALSLGFSRCHSGPYVRSSYRAGESLFD